MIDQVKRRERKSECEPANEAVRKVMGVRPSAPADSGELLTASTVTQGFSFSPDRAIPCATQGIARPSAMTVVRSALLRVWGDLVEVRRKGKRRSTTT